MSSALLQEIIRTNRLTRCFHVELHCQLQGYIRIAESIRRPVIALDAQYVMRFANARSRVRVGTRRPLPFWENMRSGSFAEALTGFWRSHKAQNRVNS